MILEEYLCSLRDAMISRGLVNTFHPFVEIIRRDERTFPAQYIGGGEYNQVHDFDTGGNGYVRQRGDMSVSLSRVSSFTACEDDNAVVVLNYPLRLVMGVPKDRLNDNAYSDHTLVFEVFDIVGTTYSASNIQDVSVQIRSADTDSLSIWAKEVTGFEYQMLFRLSYVAIDFDVQFTVNKSCLKDQCNGYY